jgi:hypothetical protein
MGSEGYCEIESRTIMRGSPRLKLPEGSCSFLVRADTDPFYEAVER